MEELEDLGWDIIEIDSEKKIENIVSKLQEVYKLLDDLNYEEDKWLRNELGSVTLKFEIENYLYCINESLKQNKEISNSRFAYTSDVPY